MHWLLQNDVLKEAGHQRLIDALVARAVPHSVHACLPGGSGLEPEPVLRSNKVIVIGSNALVAEANKRGWRPGGFINDNFDFAVQLKHWRNHMLNSDAVMHDFANVPPQPQPFFIRPLDDHKAFAGKLTDWPSFILWRDNSAEIDPELRVMVSKPKQLLREYRTWIVKGRVVTASLYRDGARNVAIAIDDTPEGQAVVAFAELRASEWSPHDAYCLDIAVTQNGLRIVEVNTINALGFYAGDMGKLVDALQALAS
jgi:hypothetical protein